MSKSGTNKQKAMARVPEKKSGTGSHSRLAPISLKPSQNSALAILIPVEISDDIQMIRLEHDKAVSRWPTHINLMWPFALENDFDKAFAALSADQRFLALPPLRIRLSTFIFTLGSKYLQLRADVVKENEDAEDPLAKLRSILSSLFPGLGRPDLEGTPHISLGQVQQDVLPALVTQLQSAWTPLEFTVDKLHFLARQGDQDVMKSKKSVPMPNVASEDGYT